MIMGKYSLLLTIMGGLANTNSILPNNIDNVDNIYNIENTVTEVDLIPLN